MKLKLILVGAALLLASCASKAPEAELSSSANTREEITTQSAQLEQARMENVDILARKEFKKADEALEDAKSDLQNGKDQEKVINNLRFSKSYLKEARSTAANRKVQAPAIFQARQDALKAGVSQYPDLRKEWMSIDDDVASDANELDKVSTTKLSDYQSRYVKLEQHAVVARELSDAKSKLNGAKKDGISKRASDTYRKTEMSINAAETVVAANVKNPEAYRDAVAQANNNASLLNDVATTLRGSKGLSESAAVKMVMQNRQITDLKGSLTQSQQNMATAETEIEIQARALREKNNALTDKDRQLLAANSSVAIQRAIEKSRSQFSKSEAEAYQQGDKLLIRLKAMHFANGKAELPEESMALLAKVADVAKSLDAKAVVVEGHTDSVGSVELNKKLSEERASSVATYFKTNGLDQASIDAEGYGFEKPIASNKTKTGRAQNRRVDVIITPKSTASTPTEGTRQ